MKRMYLIIFLAIIDSAYNGDCIVKAETREKRILQQKENGQMTDHAQENWESYLLMTDNGPVINFVNLNASPVQGDKRTLRNLVKVNIQNPGEHGFPSKTEDKILWEIEDTLENYFQMSFHGQYVGRTTHNGQRIFCFYTSATNQPQQPELEDVLSKFRGYSPQYSSTSDEQWAYYFEFLYPSPEEMQCLQNRKVVDNLRAHGDTLKQPRDVDHWIFFQSQNQRDDYKAAVRQQGFTVREERQLDDGRYILQIYRQDFVHYERIDEIVLMLFQFAQDYDGEYDGWETSVVKE